MGGRCGVALPLPRSCCYLLKCKLRLLRAGPLLCLLRTCWAMTPAIYRCYCHVPRVMRQLCVAQLCSWMAVMSFMLFYTDFVGEGLYGGVPSASPGSASRQRYDEGIRMGSLGLFLQCATSTVFSLAMSRLVGRFGSRRVYLSSMVTFTASSLVICLSSSVLLVTAMAALTGYAYATLQTLPYTLTCHYHKHKEVFMPKRKSKSKHKNGVKRDSSSSSALLLTPPEAAAAAVEEGSLNHKKAAGGGGVANNGHAYYNGPPPPSDSLEEHEEGEGEGEEEEGWAAMGGQEAEAAEFERRGVGLDFAILDSTFLLSQVFPTLFMGMIVQLAQSVTAYIACSAFFGAVAIFLANRIVFEQKDLRT